VQKVKYRVLNILSSKYALTKLCGFLEVKRSSYYKWLKRVEKGTDEELFQQIAQVQQKSKKTYGYRRVKIALRRQTGQIHNHKKILRIMQKYNLLSVIRRKHRYKVSPKVTKSDNVLNRNFIAESKNRKWVADISYICTAEGRLYLSAIKDCYDGSIVAYKYATAMTDSLVTRTIKNAMEKEQAATGLTIHSDRGAQYVSFAYHKLLKEYEITPSMSRAGTPIDNAPMESFFSILKTECIYLQKPQTIQAAKSLIDEFIDYYNNDRIQLASGLTPAEKRISLL